MRCVIAHKDYFPQYRKHLYFSQLYTIADVGKRVANCSLKIFGKNQYLMIAQKILVITHKQDFELFDRSHDACDHS